MRETKLAIISTEDQSLSRKSCSSCKSPARSADWRACRACTVEETICNEK